MADVPRWYVPVYLAIKLPLAVWFGAALAFADGVRCGGWARTARARETAFIAFTALFPVACQVISHGPAFSGLRHFLFVLPPIAVLAGIGFDAHADVVRSAAACAARPPRMSRWRRAGLAGERDGPAASLRVICSSIRWSAACTARRSATTPTTGSTGCTKWWSSWRTTSTAKTGPSARIYFVAVCGERLPFEKEAEAAQWPPAMGDRRRSRGFLHRADASRLPQRHRRQGDPHDRTHGRADRRGQGPARDHPAAMSRAATEVQLSKGERPPGGRRAQHPERERGYRDPDAD